MEVLVNCGAGLDVHKKTVTVCILTTKGRDEVKTFAKFSTMNGGLKALRQWLIEHGATHAAMEATGEYWKPVYEMLEGHLTVLVSNAQHIKNVPGRKTDPEDAAWIARLLRHGLLNPSFVPPAPIRDLRDATRTRRKTTQTISRVENRAQKVLEGAGIKLGSVVSDVFGATGRAILGELAKGNTDQIAMAELAKGSLRHKKAELALSLEGTFSPSDAVMLRHQLDLHESLRSARANVEAHLKKLAKPYEEVIARLCEIPGISRVTALDVLGEIGLDMSSWKSERHIAAWAGLCPGNHESAGKRRNVAVRKGNPFLKAALVQAATAAVRTEGTYLRSKFLRISKRRGYKRAIVAIAHTLVRTIYHMIREGVGYKEIGGDYFDRRSTQDRADALVKKLKSMGFAVSIETAPAQQ